MNCYDDDDGIRGWQGRTDAQVRDAGRAFALAMLALLALLMGALAYSALGGGR